jgi:hypothetical protein
VKELRTVDIDGYNKSAREDVVADDEMLRLRCLGQDTEVEIEAEMLRRDRWVEISAKCRG